LAPLSRFFQPFHSSKSSQNLKLLAQKYSSFQLNVSTNLTQLSIEFQLGLRDNDLLELPREIGELTRLRELHIQNNRLTVIPPEIANLELASNKSVFKMEENPWVQPIMEQYLVGIGHVLEYIKTEAYRM
jgi:hypothetical protein